MSLAASLVGRDARSLDGLLPPTDNDVDRILCEAISIALHDLTGKISGLSLSTLVGGRKADYISIMPCIFPNNPQEAGEKAHYFFKQGYRYLKTKLVGRFEEDLDRIRAIRAVAPPKAILQGDANNGYKNFKAAARAVKKFGEAGLDFFEDPLEGSTEDYCRLRKIGGARIMVDAKARRTRDLLITLTAGAADIINIHPDQPGSLSKVAAHVQITRAFNIPVAIGGTGYTGIGTAAYQQMSAALTPDMACGEMGGFFDHGMPCSFVRKPFKMAKGYVYLPETPGNGVELNEEAMKEFQKGSREWRQKRN
ncbi:MAG: mandelate racemase/muconate lactonizing enzyme family protein [Candidatus Omnitrophota bacterium]